jgi:hypothetical protein
MDEERQAETIQQLINILVDAIKMEHIVDAPVTTSPPLSRISSTL